MQLYPLPEGSTGARLFRLARMAWTPRPGVLTAPQWLAMTWRFQLCNAVWSKPQGEREATRIVDLVGNRPLLLLGGRVGAAFLGDCPLDAAERDGAFLIPFPSGRNRAWTRHDATMRAVATLDRWMTAGGFPPSDAARRAPVEATPTPAT